MRYPPCKKFCHNCCFDDPWFEPSILCDCYYSRVSNFTKSATPTSFSTYENNMSLMIPRTSPSQGMQKSTSNTTVPIMPKLPASSVNNTVSPSSQKNPLPVNNMSLPTSQKSPVSVNNVPSPRIQTISLSSGIGQMADATTRPMINMEASVKEAISNRLIIYSRSGHVVQKFPQGAKLITLPKSVEIASIIAIDSDGSIVPFSYMPETNMGIALTNRSTGEKVEASVTKEGNIINGKILSLDANNVTLMTGNQITNIRKYNSVSVGINEDVTRPCVIIEYNSKPFTLSYLLSSISWTCVGTALIDNTKDTMYLRLAGNIVNDTESDITADTVLVSGEIYQYRGNQDFHAKNALYTPKALVASAPMNGTHGSNKMQTEMLEDYVKYKVGNRIIHTKDIAELGTWVFPIIKLYVHETNDNNKVRFGYRFTAQEFIPSCSLNVYSIDANNNIDSYLGSNDIEESQKNDEVDIMLGDSTMLQCKSSIIISNDIIVQDEETARKYNIPLETFAKNYQRHDDSEWHLIIEDLNVEITNHNIKPSLLVVKHYVGNKLLIDLKCKSYKERKNGYIEWYFQVANNMGIKPRKENFTCQILTAGYY